MEFVEWRRVPGPEHDIERLGLPPQGKVSNGSVRNNKSSSSGSLNGTTLNLATQSSCDNNNNNNNNSNTNAGKKKRKVYSPLGGESESCIPIVNFSTSGGGGGSSVTEEPRSSAQPWMSSFSGVMKQASGPVTGSKCIYEDEQGYLIMVSLPFTDKHRIRVSWKNTATHGVVKIHCLTRGRAPLVTRGDRTFKLADNCPDRSDALITETVQPYKQLK